MPRESLRRSIARAGLRSLMRDPRYLDGDHPAHGALVDVVRRGFELAFDAPGDRARTGPLDADAC